MNLGWELTLPLWHLLPSDLETVTIAALLQHKAPWEAGMRRECLGGWLAVMWGIDTVCWAMVQCQRHEIPDLPNPTKLKPSALHYEGIIHLLTIHQLLVYEQPWVETYILLSSYPQLLIGCLAFTSCSLMTTRESIPKWIWVFSCSGIMQAFNPQPDHTSVCSIHALTKLSPCPMLHFRFCPAFKGDFFHHFPIFLLLLIIYVCV